MDFIKIARQKGYTLCEGDLQIRFDPWRFEQIKVSLT
jgi:hypothetical protein